MIYSLRPLSPFHTTFAQVKKKTSEFLVNSIQVNIDLSFSKPAITGSKLTTQTLEQGAEYV